jgi:hypothetical protein
MTDIENTEPTFNLPYIEAEDPHFKNFLTLIEEPIVTNSKIERADPNLPHDLHDIDDPNLS